MKILALSSLALFAAFTTLRRLNLQRDKPTTAKG